MVKALNIRALVVLSILWGASASAAVLYVDSSSKAVSPNGLGWSSAYVHLQDALAASHHGDEIRVAAGIYYPDRSSDPNSRGDRTIAFELPDGVALLGGYAGLGAFDPNERDWRTFQTVLSGDLARNDVRIISSAALAADSSRDDNSHNVVRIVGVQTALLDGFTIRSCGSAVGLDVSAAALLLDDSSATISNCIFLENVGQDGGAVAAFGGSPTITNCMFIGNWARQNGGAVYTASSDLSLTNSVFSCNRAVASGGGIFHDGGHAVLLNCTFNANTAAGGGGGLHLHAGHVDISSCILYEEVSLSGGTIAVRYSIVLTGLSGPGVIHAYPKFVDPDGPDNILGTLDDDLRLAPSSPCINAGDPLRVADPEEVDLDGNQRINGGIVDMGAYEFYLVPRLMAHWKLDESGGPVASDSAGSNHGALLGNPVWTPLDGRIDGALQFSGQGDYVNCGADASLSIRNAITVSAWIKIEAFTTEWQAIVTKGDSAWRLQGVGWDDAPGTLEFACTGVTVPYTDWGNILGNIRVDDGQWHHAAGVYDGSSMSLYVDGVLDVTSVAWGRIAANSFDVLIGENTERRGRFWRGQIDDVRVYNYALTPQEIRQLANPPTVYHVDVKTGSNINDGLSRARAFRDIQAGIYAARDGDSVLVWPGDYNEQVNFLGKAITVRSAAQAAVVQAPVGYAFSFYTAEGRDSVLSNFIIRDSVRGIYCLAASPTLKNLTIVNNQFGIESYQGGQPDIRSSIFWKNRYGNTAGCQSKYSWDWQPPAAVAHWTFDEPGGATVYDSANGNHGTIYNAARVLGQLGRALEFDGDSDYVMVSHSQSISVGRNDYTLSAWIRPFTDNGIQAVLGKVSTYDNKEYALGIEQGRIRLDVERDGNNGRAYSVPVVTPNVWQHIAVVFTSANLNAAFYHNGVSVPLGPTGYPITSLPYSLNAPLWIGALGSIYDDRAFSGLIDEVMIFNRVLSPQEIKEVYGSALDPMFADPDNGNYHLRSRSGRYVPLNPTLTGGIEGLWTFDDDTSPCIDAGDPAEPPTKEPMPNGGRVNMGAYGNSPYSSRSEWVLQGDLNRDGRVDLADFAIMASQWLDRLPWMAD